MTGLTFQSFLQFKICHALQLYFFFIQFETSLLEGEEYKKFCANYLDECVVNLASAVNDPVCWKTLNVELLNRTKSNITQVIHSFYIGYTLREEIFAGF